MFSLSKQVDYSVQLMLSLAQLAPGKSLSLKSFARERNISFLFLQKIARQLKKSGLIEATKGARGGYFLLKKAKSISLKDVVEAVEGKYSAVSCLKTGHLCPVSAACTSQFVFSFIQKDMIQTLEKYSLEKMGELLHL